MSGGSPVECQRKAFKRVFPVWTVLVALHDKRDKSKGFLVCRDCEEYYAQSPAGITIVQTKGKKPDDGKGKVSNLLNWLKLLNKY